MAVMGMRRHRSLAQRPYARERRVLPFARRDGSASRATGGSDFHGANKPLISLGTGLRNNLCIPDQVLRT